MYLASLEPSLSASRSTLSWMISLGFFGGLVNGFNGNRDGPLPLVSQVPVVTEVFSGVETDTETDKKAEERAEEGHQRYCSQNSDHGIFSVCVTAVASFQSSLLSELLHRRIWSPFGSTS